MGSHNVQTFIGLGNPGLRYEKTRHNVGRDFICAVNEKHNLNATSNRLYSAFNWTGLKMNDVTLPTDVSGVILGKYMNESGISIQQLMRDRDLSHSNIVVIVDDFMLPFGTLRLRMKGSAGGHNGLKSIIELLGTEEFPRLRVGVGPVVGAVDPGDFVLDMFTKDELGKWNDLTQTIEKAIGAIVKLGPEKAMTEINKHHF